MKNYFYLLCLLFLVSCSKQENSLLEKGISLELAQYRKQQVSTILYELDFSIPFEKTKPIASKLLLKLTIKDLKNDLLLDFNEEKSKLKSIKINGKTSEVKHENEHVIINKSTLILGENSIEISFNAGELSLNRNKEFLYTLLVPDRASTLFPCFDQPDIKANYKLTITTPKDWEVLCGALEEKKIEKGDFIEHQFQKSDLMSTYLFSFVAGKFTSESKNPGAFDMQLLYRENNKEKIEESVNEIFDIHQKSIDFLESYTDVKFPFQKMDFATIPPFQYGGMEHVGAIQYRESSLFLDKNATQTKKLSRAKLIAHETSHMWFGDLVTMRWFNDVWMKEVFANFMADKIMNPVFPEINHDLNFMMSHYPSAYSEDRTKGTNAIRQYLGNLKNAGSLYGRIIYNKAPIMMRQLEYLLGEDAFQEGIQEYIKTYSNSNADWNELVSILDKKSAGAIKNWSDVWVNSSGRPVFSEEVEYNEKGNVKKFIIHQNAEDGSDKIWTQSFKIQLKDERGYVKNINIKNMGKSFDITSATKDFKPGQVLYNTNGFGYGVFPIYRDKIDSYKDIKDEVSRGYQFINLYENMLDGKVPPMKTYKTMFKAIQQEKNELITNYLSNSMQTIFWTFLDRDSQKRELYYIEKSVFELLENDVPSNIKKTVFKLYQSIAISDLGKENLYSIWSKKKTIDNFTLNENEYSSLAMKLAIFQHSKASEILTEQQTRISNPDRLERFKWLLPSLSDDETVRDTFMKLLLQKENREKESWVQTALSNIHHPLRHSSSTKHVQSCLEVLEEIQLTGDIFFPKRWLASSVGNYSSEKAYEIVTSFLDDNSDFNPILKKKLLQTVDNLYRAQEITNLEKDFALGSNEKTSKSTKNNKIRILIVEDNEEEAILLRNYLESKNFIVVAIEDSIEKALEVFSSQKIDFVILDIYLNGKPDGITIAKKISENKKLLKPFIFLTGSSERTIFEKAKLTYPYSYLLKPFNELELEYAIELSIEKYNTQLVNTKEIKKLPFFIKQKDAFLKLTFEEITYIEVEGRYSKIYSKEDSFLLQYSLSELQNYLPENFIKIHRNFIINNNFVEKVYLSDNLLILKEDIKIPIGRSYKENLLERYKVFKR